MLTIIYDILNPLTNTRSNLQWEGSELIEESSRSTANIGHEIDGSNFWLLPSLYDADAHLSMEPLSLYASDFHRALAGGITHMNVSVPWHMVKQYGAEPLFAELLRSRLPTISPIILVFPDDGSKEFPRWLEKNRLVFDTITPPVCKLYTMDPNFDRNLEAVLKAELLPLVWCESEDSLDNLLSHTTKPLYIRHVKSGEMCSKIHSYTGNFIQTSPHMILKLLDTKRENLTVMPTPPDESERTSLIDSLIEKVDIIATDHVAPQFGGPIGPGLQSQQHFLPSLLTLSEQYNLPLEKIFEKATNSPSTIYGVKPDRGLLIVDPNYQEEISLWSNQESSRAPYEGLSLKGRVLASIVSGKVNLI